MQAAREPAISEPAMPDEFLEHKTSAELQTRSPEQPAVRLPEQLPEPMPLAEPAPQLAPAQQTDSVQSPWPCAWEEFTAFCGTHLAPDGPLNLGHLRQLTGRCLENVLMLDVESQTVHSMFNTPARLECLRRLASNMAKRPVSVQLCEPSRVIIPEATLREQAKTHPAVRLMIEEFDANVNRCVMLDDNTVSQG